MLENKTEVNLDVLINEISYDIAKEAKDKNLKDYVDKLLGILTNDGVYAYFVYCRAQKNKNGSNDVEEVFVERIIKSKKKPDLIKVLGLYEKTKDTEEIFSTIASNLDNLLFFRSILERILIYARYHIKAMEA